MPSASPSSRSAGSFASSSPLSGGSRTFLLLAAAELVVPLWAERRAATPWHPRHIAERYGLFTIIVLGESVLAASTGMRAAVDAGEFDAGIVTNAVGGLLIVFAMWWIYFDQPADAVAERARDAFGDAPRQAFVWGYGHLVVFASAAAVGAGLQVVFDRARRPCRVDHDAGCGDRRRTCRRVPAQPVGPARRRQAAGGDAIDRGTRDHRRRAGCGLGFPSPYSASALILSVLVAATIVAHDRIEGVGSRASANDVRHVSASESASPDRVGPVLLAMYDRALPQVYGYLLPAVRQRRPSPRTSPPRRFSAAVDAVRRSTVPDLTVAWLIGWPATSWSTTGGPGPGTNAGCAGSSRTSCDVEDPWEAELDVQRAREPCSARSAPTIGRP